MLYYKNLFSPDECEKNDKITRKVKIKNINYVICGKCTKFEKPKISYILEKTFVLSIICSKCKNKDEKIVKEEKSIEILKILGLIRNI